MKKINQARKESKKYEHEEINIQQKRKKKKDNGGMKLLMPPG